MKLICGKTGTFPSLSVYLEQFEDEGLEFDSIKAVLVKHLEKLIFQFDHYVPDKALSSQHWVRNPFDASVGEASEDI